MWAQSVDEMVGVVLGAVANSEIINHEAKYNITRFMFEKAWSIWA
jgi:hypothetical protein